MADVKIRIKLGSDEFEGEGAAEIIEPHLAAFLKLVKGVAPVPAEAQESAMASFRKTVRQKGRVAFLTTPGRIPDAVLLILFAQKMFLKNDSITGAQIMAGLRQSGLKIPRADHILMSHAKDGYVTYKGSARARKYSLTPKGVEHAERLAPSHVPPA